VSARFACANCTDPCTGVRRDERGRAVCSRCPGTSPPRAAMPLDASPDGRARPARAPIVVPPGAAWDALRAVFAKHTKGTP